MERLFVRDLGAGYFEAGQDLGRLEFRSISTNAMAGFPAGHPEPMPFGLAFPFPHWDLPDAFKTTPGRENGMGRPETKIEMPRVYVIALDLSLEHDDAALSPEFLAELRAVGFTMTGGLYVGLSMEQGEDPVGFDYVQVARRIDPVEGAPNSMAESFEPRFMRYRAMRNPHKGSGNWGADFINAIIAANGGTVPAAWLDEAMRGTEASATSH
ncbi:hypothetical protein [Defluviimonas salinarum]|uniref:Uncharacterized protein n=1 Tax=Defluviimonas salinarum TaxID=2992147 RepID=A0ABT3J5Q9_9RHOB|nr:hypothetical protein [Defluviimonas salinarum]MCW3783013.1 hypothetical protein [Defluviimonas salinarum]